MDTVILGIKMKYQVQYLVCGMFATNVCSFIAPGIILYILYLFYKYTHKHKRVI